jgi:hypothetical protein
MISLTDSILNLGHFDELNQHRQDLHTRIHEHVDRMVYNFTLDTVYDAVKLIQQIRLATRFFIEDRLTEVNFND